MALAEKTNLEWDLTRYFSDVHDPSVSNEVETIICLSEELLADFTVLKNGDSAELESALTRVNALEERMGVIRTYLHCMVSADTDNQTAQKLLSRLANASTARSKAIILLSAWIGTLDIERAVTSSETAKKHEFVIRRFHFLASKQMTPDAEALSQDLSLSGSTAWSRLYGNVSSKILVDVGESTPVSMSAARALAYHEDRKVRKAAFQGELAAWEANKITISACLNGVKGSTVTLCRERKWDSVLAKSLYYANIDQSTLDAMMGVARDYFPDFRRYLKAKARALGIDKCAFYDIFAPLPQKNQVADPKSWSYQTACEFVEARFSEFAPQMGKLATRAFAERWIDVEPRQGKRDGAFCAGVRDDESLILMNFKSSYGSVSTLAHELGHAYHNYCLRNVTELQSGVPMTLAETASTFCETLCRRKALEIMAPEEQLEVLEATLQGATQIVVDITSRFLFESRMIEARKKADVSPDELCELMLQAQIETYGDGLDVNNLHPYMWAAKPHYYGSDFYNYPYMFGMLFAMGLYAIYQQEGDEFVSKYENLLASSGMALPKNLAASFGLDISKSHFWEQSLKMIVTDIEKFEQLIA